MKRISILMIAMLSLGLYSFSQVRVGIRAGANIAKWKMDSEYSPKSKTGLEGGLRAEFPIAGKLSLMPELIYSNYGSKLELDGEDLTYRMNYISLPILVKYSLPKRISIFAGPQIGFAIKAEQEYLGDKTDLKDDLKKSDLFAVIGAEIELGLGLSIGARYNHGLTKLDKDDIILARNHSFGISVGYMLAPRR